jgi:hypothetical protein
MTNQDITKAGRERIKPILPVCSALLPPARVALDFSSSERRTETETPPLTVVNPRRKTRIADGDLALATTAGRALELSLLGWSGWTRSGFRYRVGISGELPEAAERDPEPPLAITHPAHRATNSVAHRDPGPTYSPREVSQLS